MLLAIHKTIPSLIPAVLMLSLAPAPQDSPLKGQSLNGCEIDIRPVAMPEAQVYYAEYQSGKQYGCMFTIHVPVSDNLLAGDWQANSTVKMKLSDVANQVTWWYDNTDPMKPKVRLRIENSVSADKKEFDTPYVGQFDETKPMGEPLEEQLRPVNNKKRMRITLDNYGITVSFTLNDA
jgi:hypothetical protein